jgi:hypothetical protein
MGGLDMISEVVARELQISRGWTREFVDKLAPYYLATLTHMNQRHATPVYQVIDEMWHAHILCTRDYADFCTRHFGRFIHHERTDGAGRDGAATDFFRDYGLSLDELKSICSERIDPNDSFAANCGSPVNCGGDPAWGPSSIRFDHADFSLANCGQEDPPAIPDPSIVNRLTATILIASCGQPAPKPPPWRTTASQPTGLANCGQPDQPDLPALNTR